MIRYNRRLEMELLSRQRQEKIRLPKIQRSEGKTRMNMFKKSLRLSMQAVENEKDRIKNVSVVPQFFVVGGLRYLPPNLKFCVKVSIHPKFDDDSNYRYKYCKKSHSVAYSFLTETCDNYRL